MWVWKKQIASDQEDEWQLRLASMPWVVITALPHSERLLVEVYSEAPEAALALYSCYGGTCAPVEDKDWVAATAPENTPPLIIRDRLVISADESEAAMKKLQARYPGRIILSFPAERAFGTGNHATTSTCLRMLCDEAKKRPHKAWRLIDAGCGTAVLGLAGMRLGAKSGICYDFDPIAVEVAARNLHRNGGAENLQLFQADVFEWTPREDEKADVLLANLFSTVLQKAFPRLKACLAAPDSVLIVSGILREQAEETLLAAQQTGFAQQKRVTSGKWVTMKLVQVS